MTGLAGPAGVDEVLPAIPDPPKLLRLGAMIKQTLEEIHVMPLDARGRQRLVQAHQRAVSELQAMLPADLRAEFDGLAPALRTRAAVSDAELRIAQTQLVGWLEGVFEGVQFAVAVHNAALAHSGHRNAGPSALLPPGHHPDDRRTPGRRPATCPPPVTTRRPRRWPRAPDSRGDPRW